MNQLIWYPKCSTCKTAKKAIEECGLEFELRDIKEEKLSQEELRTLIELSGLNIRKFFNTSGMKYKELNLKEQLPLMSDDEMIALLASDGMLVKRPIFVAENTVIVGKKEEEYKKLKPSI